MPCRRSTCATAGRAAHSSRVVSGQTVDGWLATVANSRVHPGSMDSTPVRSQTTPYGRSARSLSSSFWSAGL